MGNEELTPMRERLENLKKNPKCVPKPLDLVPEKDRRPLGEGMFTFEKMFQQKIEKAIQKIESLKNKMNASETFANYYYDMKRAEKEFLEIVAKAEEKQIDFPANFASKIESIKSKIRMKTK